MPGKVLIVGATGVVGQAALDTFVGQGWSVVALSRRVPECRNGEFVHLPIDLLDSQACLDGMRHAALVGLTHVVYAALFEKPGLIAGWREQDQMQTNLAMMRNLLEPLVAEHQQLQHISVLQGTKAYGAHIHAISIPARESAQRDAHENFYWLQEDYLKQKQASLGAAGFSWTILRPQVVFGDAIGSAMNLVPVLGVYAALCREAKQSFAFPGGPDTLLEAVDADLLAQVLVWAGTEERATNQVFNVTNGDLFRWHDLWPALAEMLRVPVGPDRACSLGEWLPAQVERWDQIVAKQGLRPLGLLALLGQSHFYADALFGYGQAIPAPPALVSTIKLRQAGFAPCIDTQDMFAKLFTRFEERQILPAAQG